ncbi:hypothetical protein FB567DRAFT_614468 [Paraphoma chrysanthemicola]|uniref:Uncharacterized protein n=1 Tax=Paraphoma chrysanthemicola TaxID=798071 RepID=A0A8K0RGT0_9PLEO|nr:hypothetical protein FB567DRAFT_614468 [Paraphoma chrysanthemicola]
MGSSGSWKTAFINVFAEDPQPVSHDINTSEYSETGVSSSRLSSPGTHPVTVHPCVLPDCTQFYMVEIPELSDTSLSGIETCVGVAKWLCDVYVRHLLIRGIIYLRDLNDQRFTSSEVNNVRLLEKLCGEKYLTNVVLATTMRKSVDSARLLSRERELVSNTWKHAIEHGSRVVRHDADIRSAVAIISTLMDRPPSMALAVQDQIVDNGLPLSATDVGQILDEIIRSRRKSQEDQREEMEQELERCVESGHNVLEAYLNQRISELMAAIDETDNCLQLLRKTVHSSHVGMQEEVELAAQGIGQELQREAIATEIGARQDPPSASSQEIAVPPNASQSLLGTAEADLTVMNPFHQQRPICGASIGAFDGHQHLPPASLGGIIMVDGEPYGLTVHHILDVPSDDEEEDVDDAVVVNEDEGDEVIQTSASVQAQSSGSSKAAASKHTRGSTEGSKSNPWLMGMGAGGTTVPDNGDSALLWDLELSDDGTNDNDTSGDDAADFNFSKSDASTDFPDDEDHPGVTVGDIEGIAPGKGEEIKITQPAIDDVDEDFFPSEEDRDDDHLSSHELGHVYASSGIRRWRRKGILHEIDWALIKIDEQRLQPYNVVQGGRRFGFKRQSDEERPPLLEPYSRRHYKAEEDEYPTEVASADRLGGMNVHCFGRTTGLQGGVIGASMNSVRIYRRETFSKSWHVAGGCEYFVPISYSSSCVNARIVGVGGDAGAWVIQNGTGLVCGIVFAWDQRSHIAYIEPMEVILEDIKRTLNAKHVYLPGSKEEKELQGREKLSVMKAEPVSRPPIPGTGIDIQAQTAGLKPRAESDDDTIRVPRKIQVGDWDT